MKKTLLAVVLASVCSLANANVKNTFDFVDAGYAAFKVDDANVTFSGFAIDGSKLLNENMYVTGQWASVNDTVIMFNVPVKVDITQFKAAVGYRHSIGNGTDAYGQVGYASQKLKSSASLNGVSASDSESADGYLAKLGLKHNFGRFEGGAFVERIDLGSDFDASTFVGVDGRFKFTDNFHAVASFAKDADVAEYKVGLSYAF